MPEIKEVFFFNCCIYLLTNLLVSVVSLVSVLLLVSVLSLVLVVSFRSFLFVVSGFSTCRMAYTAVPRIVVRIVNLLFSLFIIVLWLFNLL